MTIDPKRWPTFGANTLTPLDRHEILELESACNSFNEQFNRLFAEEYRYKWTASPLNLGNLDYDFYEFGGGRWYSDNGYGFTCAWGQILVTSFGFHWMKMAGAENLSDWVLKHDEASYVFFPWQTLWSTVESSGNQHEKAAGAWMRILNQVDGVLGVPTSWHLIPDVLRGDMKWVPKRVADEMKAIYDHPQWCFEILGLWPYEWHRKADWGQIESYLKAKQMELNGYLR